MSDFPNEVRSGLLEYKRRKADLKELIKENVRYVFSENQDVHTRAEEVHRPGGFSIYEWIEERMQELKERGLAWEDINTIIGIDIENEFKKYNNSLVSKVADKEQLSKMVNPRIMELVTEFLDQAARDFNRVYPVSRVLRPVPAPECGSVRGREAAGAVLRPDHGDDRKV